MYVCACVYKSSGRSCAIVSKILHEGYLVKIRKLKIKVENETLVQ